MTKYTSTIHVESTASLIHVLQSLYAGVDTREFIAMIFCNPQHQIFNPGTHYFVQGTMNSVVLFYKFQDGL